MPPGGAAEPLLEARSLSLRRGGRCLFEQLSLTVQAGQLWQIDGANGAGKTSLLRILSGLSRYGFAGEVLCRSRILYLGHLAAVKALLTPRENLAWHVSGDLNCTDTQIDAALARVGLFGYEDTPSHTLSAGQHRRVNLARLFLSDAPLWLLDEPFTAIDKDGVRELEQQLDSHVRAGGAVLMTSHQQVRVAADVKRLVLGADNSQ